jgi:putative acetyltransferase
MGFQIRLATPGDAAAACEVLRRSISEGCVLDHQQRANLLDAWLGNKTPQNVATWFSSPSHFALVAEVEAQVVGVALVTQAGKVSLCYVLPEFTRQGIGSALLRGLEQQARVWEVSLLKLHSTRTASGFFSRQGYIREGEEKSCFGLDCEFFWKPIKPELAAECANGKKRFCNCTSPR